MNGIIIIDKPSGKTSHDVVSDVKKILAVKKAGHTGTLDPLATGILAVCINEGTKLAQFFADDSKEYLATMLLGVETDTLDTDGKIVAERQINVDEHAIRQSVNGMVGKIKQRPPQYSALKFQGKPLYKWARMGCDINVEPRAVEIFRVNVEEIHLPYVTFTVSCSKGTYVRSICSDIGESLGCGACLAGLRRTRTGGFSDQSALSLEHIDDKEKQRVAAQHIIPLMDMLPEFAAIDIAPSLSEKIRSGRQPTVGDLQTYQIPFLDAGGMVKFTANGCLIAVGKMLFSTDEIGLLQNERPAVKILRVINN
ncbi:MAG: tRNA pseudouridine(55) synthase TruB [Deltaproteobacteria bacterium]|nr:tRNA pseudouridine(55) synthase TruB [Deltaproteobacteria bacterium]